MISYQEMRSANLDENRRMLQELGVKIPSAGVRPVFTKSKVPSKRPKQLKISDEKRSEENDQPALRSSFRVRLKTKQYYYDDSYAFEAARAKVPRVRPDNTYGSIEGVEVGHEWATRMECSYDLVHRPTVAGIHGGPEGAYSVALSGGYEDDIDLGESFTYTGEGGRDLKGTASNPKNLRTAAQSKDQTLDRGNLALSVSVDTQNPVRVIRGYKLVSPFAPEEGYRYDGLYLVKKFWVARGKSGFKVFKFAFVRCDREAAPWTSISIENSLKVRSPASPLTPPAAPNKDLEACEAPSLETSESEDWAHLEEASKGAREPEQRPNSKKRVTFYTKDSVRLFESEDPEDHEDPEGESETEIPSGVVTRRSSKAQALQADNSRDPQQTIPEVSDDSLPGTATFETTNKMSESSKPGGRAKGPRHSSKSDISSRNRTPKQSNEHTDAEANRTSKKTVSSKVSKASKTGSVSPVSLGLRSKPKSANSSCESTSEELSEPPSHTKKTKHQSNATGKNNPPVFIRKSERSPKPTEKIKSPGDFRWLKNSHKRDDGDESSADTVKSEISPKVSGQKTSGNFGSSKKSKISVEKKSRRDNLRSRQPPSVTSVAGGIAPDDTPRPKKSPKSSAEEKFSDNSLKSKKSPKIGAEEISSDNTSKPKKSSRSSAERRSSEDISKSKKSPKSTSKERSPEDTPKSKKSPRLSAEKKSDRFKKSPDVREEISKGISKLTKSPTFIAKKTSPDFAPKSKKSPRLSAESKDKKPPVKMNKAKKSPNSTQHKKALNGTPTENISLKSAAPAKKPRERPPVHGKYSPISFPDNVSVTDASQPKISKSEAESPIKRLNSTKSPKSETESRKHSKSPNKISAKSPTQKKLSSQSNASAKSSKPPKKAANKLSVAAKKLLTKMPKSPAVERAASILSRAKASKTPTNTFKEKLAMIASARAKALKIKEKPPPKVKEAAVSSKSKLKTKSAPKKEKRARAIKRPAPPDITSPWSGPSTKKKSRIESPKKSPQVKRSPPKESRTSDELDRMDTEQFESKEVGSPPTLLRFDEEQSTTEATETLNRRSATPDSPARNDSPDMEIPSSPERRMSNSSVPSSPPWTPIGSPSPQGKLLSKTPSPAKTQATGAAALADDSLDDDEFLGMMQFSLCACSDDGNSKVTIKMVDGRWIEVIKPSENPSSEKGVTDSTSSVKTDHRFSENTVNSSPNLTEDLIDAPKSTR